MPAGLVPVNLHVQPWFGDHRFRGRAVLPAVETMRVLASCITGSHPGCGVGVMEDARFGKFLEIPAGDGSVPALVELHPEENGGFRARLLSRRQLRSMTRIVEHGEVRFPCRTGDGAAPLVKMPAVDGGPVLELPAERVYRDLVPFGPAYQTLKGSLYLAEHVAWGSLRTSVPAGENETARQIGSPFLLDGAMHAACVHGQHLVDFIPFPVAFARRKVQRPTLAGQEYAVQVILQGCGDSELVYDLQILDMKGQVHETVTGLRMRDVSGGRMKPPAWIRNRDVEVDCPAPYGR